MKTINPHNRFSLFTFILVTLLTGFQARSQHFFTDSEPSVVPVIQPFTTESADVCANVTAEVLSGSGCMSAGQTSVTVQIRATGEYGATFELYDHPTLTDGHLIESKTATPHRDGARNYVTFSVSVSSATTYYVRQMCNTSYRRPIPVNVYARPGAPTISNMTVCEGESFTMSPTGSVNYTWYTDAGKTNFDHYGSSYTLTLPDGVTSKTYWVSATGPGNCEGPDLTQVTVTVDQKAEPQTLQQTEKSCPGGTDYEITMLSSQSSYTYKLYKVGTSGALETWTAPATNNVPKTFDITSPGTYYVEALNKGQCAGTTTEVGRLNVTSYDAPGSISAINDITVCVGESISISPSGGGTHQTSYRWFNSSSGTGVHFSDRASYSVTPGAGVTEYWVAAVTANGCTGPREYVKVTVNSLPGAPGIASEIDFCDGSRPTMTPTGASSYRWYTTSTNGTPVASGASFQPALSDLTSNEVTYHVAAVNAQGCESTGRTQVKLVKQFEPREFNFVQDEVPCDQAGPFVLRVTNPESAAEVTYTLYESDNPGVTFPQAPYDGNGIHWIVDNPTSYTVKAQAINGCGFEESSRTAIYSQRPGEPSADDGTTITACKGAPFTLSVDNGGAAQLTYTWYSDDDLEAVDELGTGATYNITVPNSGSATYYVVSRNSNGCLSPVQEITVTGETVNAPVGLSDDDFCEGSRPTMTPTPRSGETYHWYTAQTGGSLLHSGASWTPELNELANTNVYWVEAESALGCPSARTRVELTKEFPPNEFDFVQDNIPCDEDGPYTLRVPNPQSAAEVTYTLYESDNPDITYSQAPYDGNGIHWIVTQRTGYTVKAVAVNGCGFEEMHMTPTFTQRPGMPAADDGTNITACKESDITLSVDNGGIHQLTYYWYDNSAMTAGTEVSTTATLDITVPATGSATYYVFSRNSNNCPSPTQEITVTGEVVSAPGGLADDTVCGSSLPTMTPTGGDYYRWYLVDEGGSHIAEGETYQPSSMAIGANTFYVATVSALGCESEERTEVTFTRIPLPDPFTVLQAEPTCDNDGPYFFKVENPEDGVVYTMHSNQDLDITYDEEYRTAAEILWEVPIYQTYRVVAHRTGDCASATINELITPDVSAAPSTPNAVTSINQSGCDGETATLTVSNPGSENVTDYYWYYDSGLIQPVLDTNNEASITVPMGTTTTHYYVVAKSDIDCRSTAQHFTVVGNPRPLPPVGLTQIDICSDASLVTITLPDITGNGMWRAYDQATGGLELDAGTGSLTVPVVGETSIVHIERVSEEGCASNVRTPVTIQRLAVVEEPELEQGAALAFCETAPLRLPSSMTGVTYELWFDGAAIQTEPGTGDVLNWEDVSESGNYHVKAYRPGCGAPVTSNTLTLLIDHVGVFAVSGTGTACVVDGLDITLSDSDQDRDYYLKKDGEIDYSTLQEGTGDPLIWTDVRASGEYYVVAMSNGCGIVEMTGSAELTITEVPEPPVAEHLIVYEPGLNGAIFVSHPNPDVDFNWYDPDDEFIVSGNRLLFTDISETETYWVEAALNGCASAKVEAKVIFTLAAPPPQPVFVEACGQYYMRATGVEDIPTDVIWYWQTDPDGTERLLDASKYDLKIHKDGTYYLRAYDLRQRVWGPEITASEPVSITRPDRIIPMDCDDINAGYVAATPSEYETGSAYSYATSYEVYKPGMTEPDILVETNNQNVIATTNYVDGLGRPIQRVSRATSAQGNDEVKIYDYDAFGRQQYDYLTYASDETDGGLKANPYLAQKTFYGGDGMGASGHFENETVFYKQTFFENSPLNREKLAMGAGDAWAGSGIGLNTNYDVNTEEERIRIWMLDEGDPRSEYFHVYPTGALTVVSETDEDGKTTKKYYNNLGRLILERTQRNSNPDKISHTDWNNTYHIYDDFGNIRYVIPPLAVKELQDRGWKWEDHVMKPQVYEYNYDERGRQITKQVPGSGLEELVYDKTDKLVATRNSLQREGDNPYWSITKFDCQDRPVMSAHYFNTDDRETLQNQVNESGFATCVMSEMRVNPNAVEAEVLKVSKHEPDTEEYRAKTSIDFLPGFDTDGTEIETEVGGALSIDNFAGFNDATFPPIGADLQINEIIYYDDYRFTTRTYNEDHPGFEADVNSMPQELTSSTNGLRTGSKVRVMGSDQMLERVKFYDHRSRVIQTRNENKNGGEKIETTQFDFEGKVLKQYLSVTNPEADVNEITVLKDFEYDAHNGRLTRVSQKLNDDGELKTLGEYTYNQLGQLETKVLGSELETLDFDYNIRGWLTGINGEEVQDHNTLQDHYFAMEISYDHGFTQTNANGSISGVKWKTRTEPTVRAYGYGYDVSSRMAKADFSEGSGWLNDEHDFSIGNITYDPNGNLKTLDRMGMIRGEVEKIDQLSYSYDLNSPNRLLSVFDFSYTDEGQKSSNDDVIDYTYDVNGNLISDQNKDIESITYNHLNQPVVVTLKSDPGTVKTVTYTYDALGAKLSEESNNLGEVSKTDYIDGFTFENDELKTFSHAEGRVRNTTDGMVYDYYLKDHLGNARVTITEDTKVTTYLATMESDYDAVEEVNLKDYEEDIFLNLTNTRSEFSHANYTVNENIDANEVAALNGAYADRRVGPGKLLEVKVGDEVDMSVFAYYQGDPVVGNVFAPAAMASAISTIFGGLDGGGLEQQAIFNRFNNNAAMIAVGTNATDPDQPRAYLNYVLFDSDFDYVDAGFVQVNADAKDDHIELKLSRNITENGFIYVYLSNESDADFEIYFDDLRIKHTSGTVLQESHFYPFGMSIADLGYSEKDIEGLPKGSPFNLGWQDLGFRNYDNKVGRFFNVDPLSEMNLDQSIYQYAGNNPISNIDELGLLFNRKRRIERRRARDRKRTQDKKRFRFSDGRRIRGFSVWNLLRGVFEGGKGKSKGKTKGRSGRSGGGTHNPPITSGSELPKLRAVQKKTRNEADLGADKSGDDDQQGRGANGTSQITKIPAPKRPGKRPDAKVPAPKPPSISNRDDDNPTEVGKAQGQSNDPDQTNDEYDSRIAQNVPDHQRRALTALNKSKGNPPPGPHTNNDEQEKKEDAPEVYVRRSRTVRVSGVNDEGGPGVNQNTYTTNDPDDENGPADDSGEDPCPDCHVDLGTDEEPYKFKGFNVETESKGKSGDPVRMKIKKIKSQTGKKDQDDPKGPEGTLARNARRKFASQLYNDDRYDKGTEGPNDDDDDGFESESDEDAAIADAMASTIEYLKKRKEDANDDDGIEDYVGLDDEDVGEEDGAAQLQAIKDQIAENTANGMTSKVIIVDEESFDEMEEDFEGDADFNMLLGKSSDGKYKWKVYYGNKWKWLNYPPKMGGSLNTEMPEISDKDKRAVRDEIHKKTVSAVNDPRDIKKEMREQKMTPPNEVPPRQTWVPKPMNIFQRASAVFSMGKAFLEELKIPERYWNRNHENASDWNVGQAGGALGNFAIEKVTEIPLMVAFGLSLFDPDERAALIDMMNDFDFRDAVKGMIEEHIADYQNPDKQIYRGTYDGSEIAYGVLTGGAGLAKKMKDLVTGTKKLKGIDFEQIDLPTDRKKKMAEELKKPGNEGIRDAIAENPDLAKTYDKLNDPDIDPDLKNDPEIVKKMHCN